MRERDAYLRGERGTGWVPETAACPLGYWWPKGLPLWVRTASVRRLGFRHAFRVAVVASSGIADTHRSHIHIGDAS